MADRLKAYQSKRNFRKTPEPRGRARESPDGPRFVVQKHAATRLHYDLRLEIAGALESWAVPKGPSIDPSVKRLAIQTEPHPLDYADFEGRIPESEYGGGSVIVWDRGSFRSLHDDGRTLEDALDAGKIEVWLEGDKLRGGFLLVRTGRDPGRDRWLLRKLNDAHAAPGSEITDDAPHSVLTGRDLDEVGGG